MSLKERETKDVVIPEGWEQVGTTDKGSPIVTNGKERKIIGLNGGLLNYGNPGNSGGSGRPSERIRLKATQSLDSQIEPIGKLLETVVAKANEAFESGRNDQALACIREISRVANTLTSIGPGTKVTNVVEREEWLDHAAQAFDKVATDYGLTDPQARVAYVKELRESLNG